MAFGDPVCGCSWGLGQQDGLFIDEFGHQYQTLVSTSVMKGGGGERERRGGNEEAKENGNEPTRWTVSARAPHIIYV